MTFLVEDLNSVFGLSASCFKTVGNIVPSWVAEMCDVAEQPMVTIGTLKKPGLDHHQQKLVAEKKAEYLEKHAKSGEEMSTEGFPKGAQLCGKCNTKAAIVMDGCLTCLNCGESKCG